METRRIGSLEVSLAGLGCNNFGWRIDASETKRVVDAALDAGINFFDTADIYGEGRSEEFLGKALQGRRERAIIATKFGISLPGFAGGGKPDYVRSSIEGSLKRLGVEVINLYQYHRPDPKTPIEDTLGAMQDLVRAGKVCEIGCSNFSAEQLRTARGFASVQNEYSMLKREAEQEVLPTCDQLGIAFLPYFPLANGLLSGKYRQGKPLPEASRGKDGFGPKVFTGENLDKVERWIAFAESRGITLLELAFAWLAAKPAIASVIAGAVSPEQVRANAAAVSARLTAEDHKTL